MNPQKTSPKQFELGEEITVLAYGSTYKAIAVGWGRYPYECIAQDKNPNAMIFRNDEKGVWFCDFDLQDTGLGYYKLL